MGWFSLCRAGNYIENEYDWKMWNSHPPQSTPDIYTPVYSLTD